jgi:hypothetical protein
MTEHYKLLAIVFIDRTGALSSEQYNERYAQCDT